MFRQVVESADGGGADGGVSPVVIVEVQPVGQGCIIGRDQTGRLMRIAGVHGVKRSKKVFTTKPDPANEKPRDLV